MEDFLPSASGARELSDTVVDDIMGKSPFFPPVPGFEKFGLTVREVSAQKVLKGATIISQGTTNCHTVTLYGFRYRVVTPRHTTFFGRTPRTPEAERLRLRTFSILSWHGGRLRKSV